MVFLTTFLIRDFQYSLLKHTERFVLTFRRAFDYGNLNLKDVQLLHTLFHYVVRALNVIIQSY